MKYLTGLLNSKLIEYWLRNKGKMQGNNFQIDKEPLLAIPLINADEKITKQIESIVDAILSAKKNNPAADTANLEQQIDHLVYRLYDLTDEEISIVENKNR